MDNITIRLMMFHEKDFEDILSKYPELIEEGLNLKGRQVTVFGRRMDLLFEDRFKRKLIVELKKGPIKDDHIGQVLSYEGMLLSADNPTIRVMLIGNRVPPNIQRTLDHHGIAWREITYSRLTEFLFHQNDLEYLELLRDDDNQSTFVKRPQNININDLKALTTLTPEEVIASMKISDEYRSFRGVLLKKKSNENQAKNIITSKLGNLKYNDIRQIIELIDFAYPCLNKGKENKGPWFGRLLKSNTNNLFETDENKINDWFISLTNNYLSIENKFALLLNEPRCISGLNIGFLSLMLYLIDKKNNLVWFEGIHEGFRKLFPETEKYSGKVVQYMTFVDSAKIFAEKNGFEDTELDWIFSTGVYLDISLRRTDPFIFDKTKVSESAIRSSGPTIFEQIKEACVKTGSVVFSSEIKNLLEKKYGTNPSSVILSDYCYNRFCIGTHHGKYLFEHLAQGKFRYLGENYPYSGKIYNKPTGESEIKIIGEWKDGEKILERY